MTPFELTEVMEVLADLRAFGEERARRLTEPGEEREERLQSIAEAYAALLGRVIGERAPELPN